MGVPSLALISGLRTQHCHKLWWRSRMWFRSIIAVTVAVVCSCSSSSDSTPSLGDSICCRCSPEKTNKQTNKSCQQRILYLAKLSFKGEGKIKTLRRSKINKNCGECVTTRPVCKKY